MMSKLYFPYLLLLLCFLVSCHRSDDSSLYSLLDNHSLAIDFSNDLNDQEGSNVFTYRNYYNGGGVAIGDVNNDGLNDIYLTSNQGDNQLLINKGNWKFENVAGKAGVKGTKYWSTGVTMVDINHDGWLDIYVCNSGNAKGKQTENELFVNQRNGTFKEDAKAYGLADGGLSTHAVFFDYDLDGDLDCYVLNNSFRPISSFDFSKDLRSVVDEIGGDRLYRNDNGHFTNVTRNAGIYSSDIGFGLGVSVVDINRDGYPDLYVSNDFFEQDYLYINQKNGTFKEQIQDAVGHLSLASMGSDIADINNDGEYDIFTTEMLPEDDKRLKLVTSFESYDVVKLKKHDGYYNQYMQNCLQLNNGDGTFSEIAFKAGVAASDWSWGALSFDMDNDGWKDIFVSNGIFKDLTNQDYIEFLANKENLQKIMEGKSFNYQEFAEKMPSTRVSNYAFSNNKNLTFTNRSKQFGLDEPSFSNGAAYGDLDNDGDNDLVVNNVNQPLFVYRNNAEKVAKDNKYIQIKLKGDSLNRFGVGSTITVFSRGEHIVYYHQPARGFQSCISPNLIDVGVGPVKTVDSVEVRWPTGEAEVLRNAATNHRYAFDIRNARSNKDVLKAEKKSLFEEHTRESFDQVPVHKEDQYVDFDRERLMLQMLSTENPYITSGDVNGDGLQDFFFGSSKESSASIYIQQKNGTFKQYVPEDFKKQSYLETAGAVFGDFDGDGDEDLIVAIGGNEEEAGSNIYYPRFYENTGKGNLRWNSAKSIHAPVNASVVIKSDFDKDGDLDLFVGGRSVPGLYGSSPSSYVFRNDGQGNFQDVSKQVFSGNRKLGMVTDAKWADVDGNGYDDLIVTGNWMGICIFRNNAGRFTRDTQLEKFKGWWSSLAVDDINGDGKPDIVAGNLGLNSKFRASENEPLRIFIKDFDNNGTEECITAMYKSDDKAYVYYMKPDLVGQMPLFKKQFLRYEDYAGKTFGEVFPDELLKGAETHEINTLRSCVFINGGGGRFSIMNLPEVAQFSSIGTILCDDIDGDGVKEIITAGNSFAFKPEVGRLDASYGQVFKFNSNGFTYLKPAMTGMKIRGQVRSSAMIRNSRNEKYYLFGRNDDELLLYKLR